MSQRPPGPGYGDPRAPIGSHEWAERWRLEFQGVAKSLPRSPKLGLEFFQIGQEYRAWTLVTNEGGKPYPDFDSFCRDGQPYGLGLDPEKFRAYLVAEVGAKAADLVTVPPDGRTDNGANQHTGPREDSAHREPNPSMSDPKAKRLRAILRAPESVQQLYREDCLTQETAAKLGPKSPTPGRAEKVAEAVRAVEGLDRSQDKVAFRSQAKRAVAEALGEKVGESSPLAALKRWWEKASAEDQEAFRAHINQAPPAHGQKRLFS